MLPSWASQSVTIVRAKTTTTSRGSVIPDWTNVETTTVSGCSVQPSTTSLSQDGRVLGTSEGYTVYLPEGTDVKAGDRVIYEGDTYEINGEPKPWVAPFTRSHIQLNIIKWRG